MTTFQLAIHTLYGSLNVPGVGQCESAYRIHCTGLRQGKIAYDSARTTLAAFSRGIVVMSPPHNPERDIAIVRWAVLMTIPCIYEVLRGSYVDIPGMQREPQRRGLPVEPQAAKFALAFRAAESEATSLEVYMKCALYSILYKKRSWLCSSRGVLRREPVFWK
jgi:hypothetical protein